MLLRKKVKRKVKKIIYHKHHTLIIQESTS